MTEHSFIEQTLQLSLKQTDKIELNKLTKKKCNSHKQFQELHQT